MATPRILLLGAPGAGKGTQSVNIVDEFGVEHITTGDALRANKDMETDHGKPREYMEAGELVPDPVVNEIVEVAIDDADGFVLDGYPRNLAQAEYLDGITDLDSIVYIAVSESELIARLTGRRICEDCGTNYHLEYDPPERTGVCDACGGTLIQRDDDTEETVRQRLRVFSETTTPVIDYYEDRAEFTEIDGEQSPDEVWRDIYSAIKESL